MKIVLEGVVEPERDDGGIAQIAEIGAIVEGAVDTGYGSTDTGFFVRLQSWQPAKAEADPRVRRVIRHPTMDALTGKKVRVTVEVI